MSATARLFFWVAPDDPSAIPERVELAECGDCAAMIPAAKAETHRAWHRALGD